MDRVMSPHQKYILKFTKPSRRLPIRLLSNFLEFVNYVLCFKSNILFIMYTRKTLTGHYYPHK